MFQNGSHLDLVLSAGSQQVVFLLLARPAYLHPQRVPSTHIKLLLVNILLCTRYCAERLHSLTHFIAGHCLLTRNCGKAATA